MTDAKNDDIFKILYGIAKCYPVESNEYSALEKAANALCFCKNRKVADQFEIFIENRADPFKKEIDQLVEKNSDLSKQQISQNIIDFIDHCDGYTERRGLWFLNQVYKSDSTNIDKAFAKCLRTLRRINKEEINRHTEFILIDRVYELNYRILARYLTRKIKKEILENLQKINYFVQGIIWRDIKNLDNHYKINKNV